MRRHAESDNLVLLAVLLEFKRVVALVAINNKQTIASYSPPLCVRIKVLHNEMHKFKANLVVVVGYQNWLCRRNELNRR